MTNAWYSYNTNFLFKFSDGLEYWCLANRKLIDFRVYKADNNQNGILLYPTPSYVDLSNYYGFHVYTPPDP